MMSSGDKLDKRKWFIDGASIPLALTAFAFFFGIWANIKTESQLTVLQILSNAWQWVGAGLTLSFISTGTSLYIFLFGLNKTEGRWKFLGAATVIAFVGLAAYLTRDIEYYEHRPEDKPLFTIDFNF